MLTILLLVIKKTTAQGSIKKAETLISTVFQLLVTALGFKPKTFSSVVRCSIQLSYAAISVLSGGKSKVFCFFGKMIFQKICKNVGLRTQKPCEKS